MSHTTPSDPSDPNLRPGDEARPGTPGAGENLCPACGGSGRDGEKACSVCAGSGRIASGVGGA